MTAFPVLASQAYVTFVGPLLHRGANPTAHIAEVRYPVQHAPVLSAVKFMPADGRAACNEAISWLLLRSAGVTVPQHAALVLLTDARARSTLRRLDSRLQLLPHLVHAKRVVAWCAQMQASHSLRVLFAGLERDHRFVRALCTTQGAALAALDEALYQLDRNHGNLLYDGPTRLVAIDHEQALANHPWHLSAPPHPQPLCATVESLFTAHQSLQISTDQFQTALRGIADAAKGHAPALQACREQLEALVKRLYGDPDGAISSRVLSFIMRRTAAHWMHDRLGVLG